MSIIESAEVTGELRGRKEGKKEGMKQAKIEITKYAET